MFFPKVCFWFDDGKTFFGRRICSEQSFPGTGSGHGSDVGRGLVFSVLVYSSNDLSSFPGNARSTLGPLWEIGPTRTNTQ